MKHRKNPFALASALLCAAFVLACSASEPAPTDSDSLSRYDIEVLEGDETPTVDPNGVAVMTTDEAAIASFAEADLAASCRVTLNYCDTPWISPHPIASCRSTNCGCARAKQICASLVQQTCGRVLGYANDCR